MRLYPDTTVFGWPGDNGIGERLIGQILRGEKTATCSLKESYQPEELEQLLATRGRFVTVVDQTGAPRCNIRILDVFETPFGRPDPRLVRGEGHGENVTRFQAVHRAAWADEVADGIVLNDDTTLMVELFELVEVP